MFRTPLYDEHRRLGAKMTQFAGWEMPLSYHGIGVEHRAAREAAGLFDLSHMARVVLRGKDRIGFLDGLSTNRMGDLRPGRARYTIFCDETGGAIDDLVVFCETEHLWVIPNASNRERVVTWMRGHAHGFAVEIGDRTFETGMLAVQGPRAAEILTAIGVSSLDEPRYFHLREDRLAGVPVVLSRTGYTGEDGFEIIAGADKLIDVWSALLEAGREKGLVPAGLGARDTLRLEAGLVLYGHELSSETNPIEAGLSRFVRLEGREFIGRKSLLAAAKGGKTGARRLAGLELSSRRIARLEQDILCERQVVGKITSGTYSATLEKSIAMGYVLERLSAPGTKLAVRLPREDIPAVVVNMPFYRRRT